MNSESCPRCRYSSMRFYKEYAAGPIALKNWWACENCGYSANLAQYLERAAKILSLKKKKVLKGKINA